jgi:hypothetical protein
LRLPRAYRLTIRTSFAACGVKEGRLPTRTRKYREPRLSALPCSAALKKLEHGDTLLIVWKFDLLNVGRSTLYRALARSCASYFGSPQEFVNVAKYRRFSEMVFLARLSR